MTSGSPPGRLTLWLIDTRSIWPGKDIKEAAPEALKLLSVQEQVSVLQKYHMSDARMSLASALLKRRYISQVLDMKWSEVAVARRGDDKHGKPAALLPGGGGGGFANIDFNVSHQGGLVSLIGWAPTSVAERHEPASQLPPIVVGTDITLVGERDDQRTVDDAEAGMAGFVDIFDQVFSDAERRDMARSVDRVTLPDGRHVPARALGPRQEGVMKRGETVRCRIPRPDEDPSRAAPTTTRTTQDGEGEEEVSFDSELIIQAKLRRFYSFFAYKEAYIKLAGEALLAPWLKDLEFRNVRSPAARRSSPSSCSSTTTTTTTSTTTTPAAAGRPWGEQVCDVDIFIGGEKLEDTLMDLRAYDEGFLVASAVKAVVEEGGDPCDRDGATRRPDIDLYGQEIETLDVESVLEWARKHY